MRKVREWAFKMRGGLWTLLFVIMLFMSGHADITRITWGLLLILAGQLWRIWSAGIIGLYRGENVKALKLAHEGPYALMRNPLYFGNFMIGLGWAVIAGLNAVIVFVIAFVILYVMIIIPHEEEFLRSKFGHEYEKYCERVKMFCPVKFNLKDICVKPDMNVIMRSEIHTVISTILGTCIILAVSIYKGA
ncbi:MAG: isoprenylcysteine carboxylmethyltransferase family protein [Synergistaceae bacterium]|nr:isoprenylcysteine carboxylmethyltransferase family protein [Synergistaceae bacterium]